jgi:hypothetical protein
MWLNCTFCRTVNIAFFFIKPQNYRFMNNDFGQHAKSVLVVTASALVRMSSGLKNNTRNWNGDDVHRFYYVTTGTGFVCTVTVTTMLYDPPSFCFYSSTSWNTKKIEWNMPLSDVRQENSWNSWTMRIFACEVILFQGHLLLQGYCDGMELLGYRTALPSHCTPLSWAAMRNFIALFQAIGGTVQYKD